MCKISIALILLLIAISGKSQNIKVISQDTINLRGIVYDALGKPVNHVLITSKNRNLIYANRQLITFPDQQGAFELKGAKFNDTLTIETPFTKFNFQNNGSRFIEIHLPAEQRETISIDSPVKAKRLYQPKAKYKLKVTDDHTLDDGCTIINSPEPVGGIRALKTYVYKHLIYPEKAIRNNIEGTVEIGFTVLMDGSLRDFHVIRGIGYGCDEEAIRILQTSPKWKPRRLCSWTVEAQRSIAVMFKLTDK